MYDFSEHAFESKWRTFCQQSTWWTRNRLLVSDAVNDAITKHCSFVTVVEMSFTAVLIFSLSLAMLQ